MLQVGFYEPYTFKSKTFRRRCCQLERAACQVRADHLSIRMGQRIDVCRSSTHVDFCARQSSTTAIVKSWGLTYQLPSFATLRSARARSDDRLSHRG